MRKIYIAGINGMVGSQIARQAAQRGYMVAGKSSSKLDFTNRHNTFKDLELEKPDALVIAAAVVGGIGANIAEPVRFLTNNLQIQSNLIDGAFAAKINKLVFLGSSCIYPKMAPQPLLEDYLFSGQLESTNKPYAVAKLAGIELVEAYRTQFGMNWVSVLPSNLYGMNDDFSVEKSHVLAALIRRIHEAKINELNQVTVWGDGSPLREFLNSKDVANGILHILENDSEYSVLNLGSEEEVSVKELAILISKIVDFHGELKFDLSKPNGTPRKLMSSEKFRSLGWKSTITLENGIRETYDWYKSNYVERT